VKVFYSTIYGEDNQRTNDEVCRVRSLLYELVLEYQVSIPVTTVASESVFSTEGRVISPHRSRLAPKTVEGLMCMQTWGRADMLGDQSCFINALMTCLEDEDEEMVT
jgi:hypothetical protein